MGNIPIGGDAPLVLFAGPCVIESEEHIRFMARELKAIAARLGLALVFKASYDKANRTSVHGFRGPGVQQGLAILKRVKEEFGLPILTDVHTEDQVGPAAEVCDILQIPAFLSRQTDFVAAMGRSGRPINVKKGQFLAPGDVKNIATKLREVGCEDIVMTDRGTSFGYGTLVSDFRGLATMRDVTGLPVCFDATHSVQQPGGLGTATGGQSEFVPVLARAACAVGVNALFIETHDNPAIAKSDGPNMVPLADLERMLEGCLSVDAAVRAWHSRA